MRLAVLYSGVMIQANKKADRGEFFEREASWQQDN